MFRLREVVEKEERKTREEYVIFCEEKNENERKVTPQKRTINKGQHMLQYTTNTCTMSRHIYCTGVRVHTRTNIKIIVPTLSLSLCVCVLL